MRPNNIPFIHYEDDELLIVCKPRGLATAPLVSSNKPTLCHWVFNHYPALAHIKGRQPLEGGLLHRLDNDTEGLVLFAKTQKSYYFLQEEQHLGRLQKGYLAYSTVQTATFSPLPYALEDWQQLIEAPTYLYQGQIETRFVKALAKSSKVKAIQANSASIHATKIYNTYINISREKNCIRVECWLNQGFRHQVRAVLQALGLPIIGDRLYHPYANQDFMFWATTLKFKHPSNGNPLVINLDI